MDRAASNGDWIGFPIESYGVSAGNGRSRTVWPTVSGLRFAGATDRLRRKRMQLLRNLPDRRAPARRPRFVAAIETGLAAESGRMGNAPGVAALKSVPQGRGQPVGIEQQI